MLSIIIVIIKLMVYIIQIHKPSGITKLLVTTN